MKLNVGSTSRLLTAGTLLAANSLLWGSRPEESSEPVYKLHATYHVGEIHIYSIVSAITGAVTGTKAVGVRFDMRMKVLKSAAERNTIEVLTSAPYSGKTLLPTGGFKPKTVVLDSLNRPVGKSTSGEIFSVFPDRPVKIGDRWNGESNLAMGGSSGAMVATAYKLNAIRTFKGRKIAEITMQLGGLASGEGTELIDLADGSLLACDLNLQLNHRKKIPVQIMLKRVS